MKTKKATLPKSNVKTIEICKIVLFLEFVSYFYYHPPKISNDWALVKA
jgi:hypothetical protein